MLKGESSEGVKRETATSVASDRNSSGGGIRYGWSSSSYLSFSSTCARSSLPRTQVCGYCDSGYSDSCCNPHLARPKDFRICISYAYSYSKRGADRVIVDNSDTFVIPRGCHCNRSRLYLQPRARSEKKDKRAQTRYFVDPSSFVVGFNYCLKVVPRESSQGTVK